jgi:Tfp pilus assembly protein PilP
MRRAIILVVGMLMAAAGNGLFAQTKPAPAAKAAAKPAGKPAAKAAAKATAKPAAKPAPKAQKTSVKKAAAAPAEGAAPAPAEEKVARRDPFESLVGRDQAAAAARKNLPPGKAGLEVSSLRLDGIVRAPNGMIAVVTNPQARTYFLREGDQLYDGRVEKIAMDSVSFHEMGKDAFGKPVERQVNKRIYSSAGEQQ